MKTHKNRVILVFGYPLKFPNFGGLIWIKQVSDYIEMSDSLRVKKISIKADPKKHVLQHIFHIRAVLEGYFTNPNIAILDAYGEAALLMWILLRLFKPSAKIVTVFHHHEPLSTRYKKARLFTNIYCKLIDYFTNVMLKNSNKILTVSLTSSHQLHSVIGIKDRNKIAVVGCSDEYILSGLRMNFQKDIDFLCVGRFEKFHGIEDIWKIIKKKSPKSKFVIVGRISLKDLIRLRSIGIEHKEIVSEEEKILLYSRAKVFIFPSIFEGFGMAISEALAAGLSVIAWRLPVFEERFGRKHINNLKLVEIGKTALFAQEVLAVVKNWNNSQEQLTEYQQNLEITKTWEEVGKDVSFVLNKLS
jgi:glycosyltransferase involved in cell wall biosynthesis